MTLSSECWLSYVPQEELPRLLRETHLRHREALRNTCDVLGLRAHLETCRREIALFARRLAPDDADRILLTTLEACAVHERLRHVQEAIIYLELARE